MSVLHQFIKQRFYRGGANMLVEYGISKQQISEYQQEQRKDHKVCRQLN